MQDLRQPIFDALLEKTKKANEPMNQYFYVEAMRTIAGNSSMDMLKPPRPYLEQLKKQTTYEELSKCLTTIMMALDGQR